MPWERSLRGSVTPPECSIGLAHSSPRYHVSERRAAPGAGDGHMCETQNGVARADAAPRSGSSRRVYALVGVPPEIQAYALAKYSRSAQAMLESIAEISAQRAQQFLNTFYFQYGHRSIADMAHVVIAVEQVSILAAIALVDEPLWDGQERSTRYQDFSKTGYHVPAEVVEAGRVV